MTFRYSDGLNYQGYVIADGGDVIILPPEAVRDLMALNKYATQPALKRWRDAVELDLNIEGVWKKYSHQGHVLFRRK